MNTPRTIVLDFETAYHTKDKYSLRGMSVPEFILDKRFKVFGLSVGYEDGKTDWIEAPQVPSFLESVRQDILVFHNAFFDVGVLKWHYHFTPAYVIDTLLLANHVLGSARDAGGGRNDLASLALRLGLPAKGREIEDLNGVMDPDEEQLSVLAIYAKRDAMLTRRVLDALLPEVMNQDFELWLLDHSLRIYFDKPLTVDTAKIMEAKTLILKRSKEVVAAGGVDPTVLSSDKQFAVELRTRLDAAKLKLPMKLSAPRKDGKSVMIPAIAKGDPAFLELAESGIPAVVDLVNARLASRSSGTISARIRTMEKYVELGLGLPVHLVYYGAHTGRFSGGGGFNFQNLTSPARAATEVDRYLATLVREAIAPRPGKVFVAVDAAQIEARVLAWVSGEVQIEDAFAKGKDLYSDFISEAINEDIHKPIGDETKQVQVHLKLMRQVGKEAILGLGYSMGVDKFMFRLRKEKALWPMLTDEGRLSPNVCKGIVETYREKYTKIPQFWDDINRAFLAAIRGAVREVGPLTIRHERANVVSIQLPSTRKLYYRDLRLKQDTTPNGHPLKVWVHGSGRKIYGGLLTENIVQAISRDILAESILNAEQAGYPVGLHVHDEIVCEVDEQRGQACLDFLIESLSIPPAWGEGMVLGAEGHIGLNLGK